MYRTMFHTPLSSFLPVDLISLLHTHAVFYAPAQMCGLGLEMTCLLAIYNWASPCPLIHGNYFPFWAMCIRFNRFRDLLGVLNKQYSIAPYLIL